MRRADYDPLAPATREAMVGRVTVSIPQAQVRCSVSRRTIYNWLVRIFEDTLFREGEPR